MRPRDGTSPDRVETVIGRGTRLSGKIHSQGTLRIEGQVQGTVEAQGDIVVAEGAVVEAELRGRQISIAGQVKGNVFAQSRLELVGSGRLVGDFHAPKFVVAEGATFEGHSHMLDAAKAVPAQASPAPAAGQLAAARDR
ncbi:MAG: polymer-forming cytoskeletal protein [Clostridia bacterium]|nr:polymer-forming cytoskeletal protein [Clostridia bacterium]